MKNNRVKKLLHIVFIIFIILCIFCILSNCIFTNAADMKDIYNYNYEESKPINDRAGQMLWIVTAIGISTGVIMIAIIGFKYIVSSPEGKADLKKQLILYCIGAFLLMSGSTLVGIIAKFANTAL